MPTLLRISRHLLACLLILSAGVVAPAAAQVSAQKSAVSPASDTASVPISAVAPAQGERDAITSSELLITRAKTLLSANNPDQAWRVLNDGSSSFAGDANFDYLLGIAALDSGRFAPAVLALERVVAQQPSNLQARAELGRALFALREMDAARKELETVASANVPIAVKDNINRYLDAIKSLSANKKSETAFYIEAGYSFDSNVNFGSAQNEWLLADGARLIPSDGSLGLKGQVARIAVGVVHQRKLPDDWDLFAQVVLSERDTLVGPKLSLSSLEGTVSVVNRAKSGTTTVSALGLLSELNGKSLRNVFGLSAQWQSSIRNESRFGFFIQTFAMNYPLSSDQRTTRNLAGATLWTAFSENASGSLALTLGNESSSVDLPQYSFKIASIKAVNEVQLSQGWRISSQLSIEKRRYDGVQALFAGLQRRDTETELRITADHTIDDHWSIAPQISLTRNASTLGPNDFRRGTVGITAKYRF